MNVYFIYILIAALVAYICNTSVVDVICFACILQSFLYSLLALKRLLIAFKKTLLYANITKFLIFITPTKRGIYAYLIKWIAIFLLIHYTIDFSLNLQSLDLCIYCYVRIFLFIHIINISKWYCNFKKVQLNWVIVLLIMNIIFFIIK